MPSRCSQNNIREPNFFDNYDEDAAMGNYDEDAAMGCVSALSSTQCTPQYDTSDEQAFSGDLHTPSYSIEDGFSETGPMTDLLMADLVSPQSIDCMATLSATFVDIEEPNNIYSILDCLGIDDVGASTNARDSDLRLTRRSAQSTVHHSLLDMTIDVSRYLTNYRLHRDSMVNRRNDISRHSPIMVPRVLCYRRNSIAKAKRRARSYIDPR